MQPVGELTGTTGLSDRDAHICLALHLGLSSLVAGVGGNGDRLEEAAACVCPSVHGPEPWTFQVVLGSCLERRGWRGLLQGSLFPQLEAPQQGLRLFLVAHTEPWAEPGAQVPEMTLFQASFCTGRWGHHLSPQQVTCFPHRGPPPGNWPLPGPGPGPWVAGLCVAQLPDIWGSYSWFLVPI